jgi:hypothetical protein
MKSFDFVLYLRFKPKATQIVDLFIGKPSFPVSKSIKNLVYTGEGNIYPTLPKGVFVRLDLLIME